MFDMGGAGYVIVVQDVKDEMPPEPVSSMKANSNAR
jgi:hypothetical protein